MAWFCFFPLNWLQPKFPAKTSSEKLCLKVMQRPALTRWAWSLGLVIQRFFEPSATEVDENNHLLFYGLNISNLILKICPKFSILIAWRTQVYWNLIGQGPFWWTGISWHCHNDSALLCRLVLWTFLSGLLGPAKSVNGLFYEDLDCPAGDISRFSPQIDRIFFWKALHPFFCAQDEGFSKFRSR